MPFLARLLFKYGAVRVAAWVYQKLNAYSYVAKLAVLLVRYNARFLANQIKQSKLPDPLKELARRDLTRLGNSLDDVWEAEINSVLL